MNFRTTTKALPNTGREPPEHCSVCGKWTRCGKPYCPDHVLRLPYAAAVYETDQAAWAEVGRVELSGAEFVDMAGIVVQDVLAVLEHRGGRCTTRGIRRQVIYLLSAGPEVTDVYVRRLAGAGLVLLEKPRRKASGEVVVLPNP